MSKPRIHHVIVLDKSGSMHRYVREARDMFNSQLSVIKTLKKENDKFKHRITLVLFSNPNIIEFVEVNSKVKRAKTLSPEDYRPGGLTALNDAIGSAISKVRDFKGENDHVYFNIVTDGEENASERYTSAQIKGLIKDLEADGKWTFTVQQPEGVNVASNYNINPEQVFTYRATSAGITRMNETMASVRSSYVQSLSSDED